jgi:hypothetical protein
MTAEKLGHSLAGMIEGMGEQSAPGVKSPVRKEATGNIRNLKAMGLPKFLDLQAKMADYRLTDPEGFAAVEAEAERRGL